MMEAWELVGEGGLERKLQAVESRAWELPRLTGGSCQPLLRVAGYGAWVSALLVFWNLLGSVCFGLWISNTNSQHDGIGA